MARFRLPPTGFDPVNLSDEGLLFLYLVFSWCSVLTPSLASFNVLPDCLLPAALTPAY